MSDPAAESATKPAAAPSETSPEPDAPPHISSAEAAKHVGKERTVEMEVKSGRRGDTPVVFLNSADDFRDPENFTVMIFADGLARFEKRGVVEPHRHFMGKRIRVTGAIENYRGRPQVRVDDPRQIEILKPPRAAEPEPRK